MTAKVKAPIIKLPIAVARYPHVHTPDTDGKFADNKYKITLVFDGDEDMEPVTKAAVDYAIALNSKLTPAKVNVLVKEGDESTTKDGDPVPELQGKRLLTAKTGFAPALYGPDKKPLAEGVEIRGGDVVQCLVTPTVSDKPIKNSVTFRLVAVQLKEKKSGQRGDYSNFFDGDDSEDATASNPSEGESEGAENDLPF